LLGFYWNWSQLSWSVVPKQKKNFAIIRRKKNKKHRITTIIFSGVMLRIRIRKKIEKKTT
jgi:hypothetical protein